MFGRGATRHPQRHDRPPRGRRGPRGVPLSAPGQARAFHGRELDLAWDLGRPTASASIADDAHQISGRFVIATGMNAPIRLADDLAQAPGAARPDELYPDGVWLA